MHRISHEKFSSIRVSVTGVLKQWDSRTKIGSWGLCSSLWHPPVGNAASYWPHGRTGTHAHTHKHTQTNPGPLASRPFVWFKYVHKLYSCTLHYCTFTHGRWRLLIREAYMYDSELATPRWRTPQFPSRFGDASHAARTFVFHVASLFKVKKVQPYRKLVAGHREDGGDLCEADDSELATARFRVPQLPPSFNETF